MGNRFQAERYEKSTTPRRWFGSPKRWFKRYVNRVDRHNLNQELDKEDPDVPPRWSARNWGLCKWW